MLATVFGDAHDIGKNLVNTILSNNGYRVIDLGKQVPMNVILERAIEERADAIGLSALLVSTSKQMPICVAEQDARGLRFPVVIGGAAINRDFGRRIALPQRRRGRALLRSRGFFYARDAFEGLEIVDALTGDPTRRTEFESKRRTEAERARTAVLAAAKEASHARARARPRVRRCASPMCRRPRSGVRGPSRRSTCARFAAVLRPQEPLSKLSWRAANAKGEEWERLVREEFDPRRERYQHRAERETLLSPQVVYGYFPAAASGDDALIYDPEDHGREIARFRFARQLGGEHLCLADYVREPVDGRASDVVALQVVTVGADVGSKIEALHAAGDYSESYFLHGFSVQSAEALAELSHRRVRAELQLEREHGKRYSWGYGACPDLSQHRIVWELLDVEQRIGARLTDAFQIVPEQSTAAIVLHHPQASYFNAAALRELEPA